MKGSIRVWLIATVVVLALSAVPLDAQCAMCRRALSSPEGQRMIGALRSGIVVLLAAPFAVFGAVAILAVRRFGAPPGADPAGR